jgi:hypothetical protein
LSFKCRLLDEISGAMEAIALCGRISRVVHLNRNERAMRDIKVRLDNAYHDFVVCPLAIDIF